MDEMKSGGVALGLAAQLASWRAVLIFVHTWATCKPWQRKDFHEYSILLADCLKQSKQTIGDSVGVVVGTESKKVGKAQRKRGLVDVDEPGANPEPELGPHGPTLKKKQVLQGFDSLALHSILHLADSDRHFEKETRAGDELVRYVAQAQGSGQLSDSLLEILKAMEAVDPAGSPSSVRKVANTTCPSPSSPSAAHVSRWWSFLCLANGK